MFRKKRGTDLNDNSAFKSEEKANTGSVKEDETNTKKIHNNYISTLKSFIGKKSEYYFVHGYIFKNKGV